MRLAVVLVGLALFACSSDSNSDRTLDLRTGDITESAWRNEIRSDPAACPSIEGMSVEAIAALQSRTADSLDFPEGGSAEDALRAAAILKEECDRIAN